MRKKELFPIYKGKKKTMKSHTTVRAINLSPFSLKYIYIHTHFYNFCCIKLND